MTKKLFSDTIQFYPFSEEELEVIKHARESYIFNNGDPWIKKAEVNFNVMMGAIWQSRIVWAGGPLHP